MIKLGRYDQYDKWQILCEYWQNRSTPLDVGVDRFKRPSLGRWDAEAFTGGRSACYAYIRHKNNTPSEVMDPAQCDPLISEIKDLVKEIGVRGLQKFVEQLAMSITSHGYLGATAKALSPALVERFKEVFKEGALRRLIYTEEVGEIPSIDVLRSLASSFPIDHIRYKQRVLDIFCGNFYGINDVIHVFDASPDQVTLLDIRADLLEIVKMIYPSSWSYVCSDYKAFLAERESEQVQYDVVIADPWKGHARSVGWDFLPTIMGLTDTYITGYFGEMFEELGAEPDDLGALSRIVSAHTGVAVDFAQVMRRAEAVYWAVIKPA